MENKIENPVLSENFQIRQKIQAAIIQDFYGLKNPEDVSNEMASEWATSRAELFGTVYKEITDMYPSFFDDAKKDFESAVKFVGQKLVDAESRQEER